MVALGDEKAYGNLTVEGEKRGKIIVFMFRANVLVINSQGWYFQECLIYITNLVTIFVDIMIYLSKVKNAQKCSILFEFVKKCLHGLECLKWILALSTVNIANTSVVKFFIVTFCHFCFLFLSYLLTNFLTKFCFCYINTFCREHIFIA